MSEEEEEVEEVESLTFSQHPKAVQIWQTLDSEQRHYFQFFHLTEAIKKEQYMKVKTGVAGHTPSSDRFSRLKNSAKQWMVVSWTLDEHVSCEDWCLALFDKSLRLKQGEEVGLDRIVRAAAKIIPVSEIADVYIDPHKPTAFRVYRGMEVIQFSPASTSSEGSAKAAASWADAIFALLQLQSFADKRLLSRRYVEYKSFLEKIRQLENAGKRRGNKPTRKGRAGLKANVPTPSEDVPLPPPAASPTSCCALLFNSPRLSTGSTCDIKYALPQSIPCAKVDILVKEDGKHVVENPLVNQRRKLGGGETK
eukprot:gene1918-2096_t